ncbi:ArnT family glycosyltransferase [Rhodospira trueperi]|uniref:Dolichyl-phosphate-mannose-protein mannosyltransferase n=1 Tax=Rhodospira trueperi TaxID=69960 RepID=A0A1G7GQA8_9PROT|nr:glycosyltransferase family 39 protein [Rhodospira trueperi]SDE90330.1 Dolichyl-phosphate-mannose-protein mannosyltransferase [Rhodospira trueperi]
MTMAPTQQPDATVRTWSVFVCILLLTVAAIALRAADLGLPGLQNDETVWHERSMRYVVSLLGPFAPAQVEALPVFWQPTFVDLRGEPWTLSGWPFDVVMPAPHPGVVPALTMGLSQILLADGASSWSVDLLSRIEAARVPGIAFGLLMIGCVLAWGRTLVGTQAVLFAAAILAVEPIAVGFSRLARIDLAAVTLITIAVLGYLQGRVTGRPLPSVLSAVAFGAALATNPYGLFAVPAILTVRLLYGPPVRLPEHRPRWALWHLIDRSDWIWACVALTFFLVSYPNLWPNPLLGLVEIVKTVLATPHVQGEAGTRMPVSHWFYLLRSPQHLTPWVLAFALVGIALLWRRDRRAALVLIVWGGVILLLLSVPPGRKNLKNFLFVLPVVALFAGVAVSALTDWIARRVNARGRLRVLATVVLLSAGGATSLIWWPYPAMYLWPWVSDPQESSFRELVAEGEGVKEAVQLIVERTGPDARIGMFTGENNAMYYHPREHLGAPVSPEDLVDYDWLVSLPKLTFGAPDWHPLVAWVRETEPDIILRHHQIEMVRLYRLDGGQSEGGAEQ